MNTQNSNIYSVSSLNRAAKSLLETGLGVVWLSGEISNLTIAVSGHWYFTLKDHSASVKCAMFKGNNRRAGFIPKHGQQVLVRGKLSLYEARGDYQLIAESMQPEGDGLLKQQFDQLKCQLAAEGLFSEQYKKPLPQIIKRIGIITSSTGAALHDILSVLKRRDPRLQVIIYPSQVQGAGSAESVASQIQLANARNECDLLIVGRGGGSLEDLWCFNEAVVAHAIFNSQLPIISAVGHEIDVTISDFVADVRAATPSAAAELVSQNKAFVSTQLETLLTRLKAAMNSNLQRTQHQQALLTQQLLKQDPKHKLQQQTLIADELSLRLQHAMNAILNRKQQRENYLQASLMQHSPEQTINLELQKQSQLLARLKNGMQNKLKESEVDLQNCISQLNTVSPLATLARGYAIVKDEKGKVTTDASLLSAGDVVDVRLDKGTFKAKVI
ncbi:exodeoxyribonuclease VII large subunit [Psychromonas sp. Urea-02u-13]|uniref:exodeoxyribonuclease VII large subunit n=1 Tax=Psychromonas sp. Urea-02u-13 TaxID=2058326 RepID=UPI000C33F349|nr:exodeoxyribonuclease VII large subunit [Psychromonas sp. Urea-02u-13]PKG38144.1 exodeoxyribonuclease VII large subunit [Psychromonas sp. Urea-02u-13]